MYRRSIPLVNEGAEIFPAVRLLMEPAPASEVHVLALDLLWVVTLAPVLRTGVNFGHAPIPLQEENHVAEYLASDGEHALGPHCFASGAAVAYRSAHLALCRPVTP